jgi:hypothetical protein
MMKYLVCTEYYGQKFWEIVEYNGPEAEAEEFFARKAFYGGDEEAVPGQYIRDLDKIEVLIIVPLDKATKVDIESVRLTHQQWHDEKDARELEKKERSEYERLKRKYT